jgi:hypothetical protein
VFHKFFNSIRKYFFLVASSTNFALCQFLEWIINEDETWVHHYKPESMTWKRLTSPVTKKFKSTISQWDYAYTFLGIWKVQFWFISLQRLKMLRVRTNVTCYKWNWSPQSKNWCGEKWLKRQPKNFFSDELKNSWNAVTSALKSGGMMLKSNISLFRYIYNKSAFFFFQK